MDENTKKAIRERFNALPESIKNYIMSSSYQDTLTEIGGENQLNIEQIETLETETTLVLLGIVSLEEYENIIKNGLNTSEKVTENILEKINNSIIEKLTNNDQKLDDRFSKLPEKTQNAIKASGYETSLYEISKKYNLTVAQMNIFGEAVMNIMSGIISSEEFPNAIKYLNLPSEKVVEITNDTNEKIFKNIREKLIQNTQIEEKTKESFSDQSLENKKMMESREELLKIIENPEIITKKSPPIVLDAKNEITSGEKIELTAPIEAPVKIKGEEAPSILSKKLSESFQIPMVQTDHSLSNLSPNKTPSATPRVDPYREPTE